MATVSHAILLGVILAAYSIGCERPDDWARSLPNGCTLLCNEAGCAIVDRQSNMLVPRTTDLMQLRIVRVATITNEHVLIECTPFAGTTPLMYYDIDTSSTIVSGPMTSASFVTHLSFWQLPEYALLPWIPARDLPK